MPQHAFETFRPTKPMPLVMINGDADDVLPYRGGDVGNPSGFFRTTASVEQTAALFAKAQEGSGAREPRRTRIGAGKNLMERIDWLNGSMYPTATVVKVVRGGHDVIGWRLPFQAFLGLPPRGLATATVIIESFVASFP
jgi:poly(3-hydroxybutyrate) depolymerase